MAINKNKVMEAAQKFVEKGQIDKAIKEYLKVVQEDPKDVRVWLKIGDLYAKKGAKAEATETYMKVAQFYGEQGFYLKAVAVYKQILKIEPRLIDVNLKLAEVYRQLGLLSDAMQQYELVAAHYHREGKTREALATIKDLVELDPENVATRIKLAELYSKESMATEAIAEFAHAAEFLRAHQRMDDFIKVAERLVWHQPENHAINRELALLYLKRNDPRRALQKLQACFKADPRDVDTLSLLAQAFQALDQKPKTISVWKELARIHQENGQQPQALDVYRRILSLAPDDADALAALGRQPRPSQAVPSIPAPARPPDPPAREPAGSASFPRVATPIGGVPARAPEPLRLSEQIPPVRDNGPGGGPRRPTGSFPIVEPFDDGASDVASGSPMTAPTAQQARGRGRFDVDEGSGSRRGQGQGMDTGGGETTSRRDAKDVEVELEVDDFGGGGDEMILSAGADPSEAHADEIAKILTETDVYTKYGLHQKAIEHLKKVFDIDSKNVEAREKLKDVFIALGRNGEAAAELARLAEHTAAQNPQQATGYLRELFAIAPDDARGRAIAQRHRLAVESAPHGGMSNDDLEAEFEVESPSEVGAEIEVEPAENDVDLAVSTGDLDAGVAMDAENEVAMEFDELGLDDAPAASLDDGMPEVAVMTSAADPNGALDFELDDLQVPPSGGMRRPESTQVVEDDQVAAELALDDGEDEPQELAFDGGATRFEDGLSPKRGAPPPPVSLPAEASTFDEPYDGFDAPSASNDASEFSLDGDSVTPGHGVDALSHGDLEPAPPAPEEADGPTAAGSTLEDELDEADFFVGQNLFAEAREILTNLLARYPNNKLVLAKLQDVDAMEGAEGGEAAAAEPEPAPPPRAPEPVRTPTPAPAQKRPAVIAKTQGQGPAMGDSDADTHYDLGLAYKEMGLFDEAIKEFSLVREAPGRAVGCHHIIGVCHMERGKYSEAVTEFKNGLYVEGINERESLALYFELGAAYQALGDAREALYYFEKVAKRDPRFRDVNGRIEQVKAAAGGTGRVAAGDATLDATGDDFGSR